MKSQASSLAPVFRWGILMLFVILFTGSLTRATPIGQDDHQAADTMMQNKQVDEDQQRDDLLGLADGESAGYLDDMNDDEEVDEVPVSSSERRTLSRRWQEEQADSLDGMDTNIEGAKIELSPNELAMAAGHHHHHHHHVHGKLDMGAHTGKKGSFGWHDKHPVGGKGRR